MSDTPEGGPKRPSEKLAVVVGEEPERDPDTVAHLEKLLEQARENNKWLAGFAGPVVVATLIAYGASKNLSVFLKVSFALSVLSVMGAFFGALTLQIEETNPGELKQHLERRLHFRQRSLIAGVVLFTVSLALLTIHFVAPADAK